MDRTSTVAGNGAGHAKYVLHGGRSYVGSTDNRLFYQEILNGLSGPVRILLVYYARDENDWPKLLELDRRAFSSLAGDRQLQLEVAAKDLAEFGRQLQAANVILIVGGKTINLKRRFKEIPNLTENLSGKVVAGSSAGAHVLSLHYYNRIEAKINGGLGLIPLKVFCHYDDSQVEALRSLQKHGDAVETLVLEEGKFAAFSVLK